MASIRVFHCDDSEAFRVLVREMLAELGDVTVVGEAGSMDEAVAALPEANPDVVLVDMIGGEDTAQPLARLRAAAPEARFLLYTGMPASRVSSDERHVHKSVTFEELHRIITETALQAR